MFLESNDGHQKLIKSKQFWSLRFSDLASLHTKFDKDFN